jgi:DNA repair protein RadC
MMRNLEIFNVRYVREKGVRYTVNENSFMNSPDSVVNMLNEVYSLSESAEEYFYLLCLDTKNRIVSLSEVSHGTLNSSTVHPREVFKRAILANACSVIFAHNHPSGNPAPSQSDIDITIRLAECGELLGIKVLDHIIVGESSYYSFKEQCMI